MLLVSYFCGAEVIYYASITYHNLQSLRRSETTIFSWSFIWIIQGRWIFKEIWRKKKRSRILMDETGQGKIRSSLLFFRQSILSKVIMTRGWRGLPGRFWRIKCRQSCKKSAKCLKILMMYRGKKRFCCFFGKVEIMLCFSLLTGV